MKLYRQSVSVLALRLFLSTAENRINSPCSTSSASTSRLGRNLPVWKMWRASLKAGYPVLASVVMCFPCCNECMLRWRRIGELPGNGCRGFQGISGSGFQFLQNTKNWVRCRGTERRGGGICHFEHVEFAGVHSGGCWLVFPAQKIYLLRHAVSRKSVVRLKELNISGPFNIQFLARNNEVKVIECNLRVSRSDFRSYPKCRNVALSRDGHEDYAGCPTLVRTSRRLTSTGLAWRLPEVLILPPA